MNKEINDIIKNNNIDDIVKLFKYNNLISNNKIIKKGGNYLPVPIYNQIPDEIEIYFNDKDIKYSIELISTLLLDLKDEVSKVEKEIEILNSK